MNVYVRTARHVLPAFWTPLSPPKSYQVKLLTKHCKPMASRVPVYKLPTYEEVESMGVASMTGEAQELRLQKTPASTINSFDDIYDEDYEDYVDYHSIHGATVGVEPSAAEINIAHDQAYAQMLQDEDARQEAAVVLSRQHYYALKLAAAETRNRLDNEFAVMLQAMIDEDKNADHDGYDAVMYFIIAPYPTQTHFHIMFIGSWTKM